MCARNVGRSLSVCMVHYSFFSALISALISAKFSLLCENKESDFQFYRFTVQFPIFRFSTVLLFMTQLNIKLCCYKTSM